MYSNVRSDITNEEIAILYKSWIRWGNSWLKIAKTLGRSKYWVKSSWKKLIKKEGIDANIHRCDLRPIIRKLLKEVSDNLYKGSSSNSLEYSKRFSSDSMQSCIGKIRVNTDLMPYQDIEEKDASLYKKMDLYSPESGI